MVSLLSSWQFFFLSRWIAPAHFSGKAFFLANFLRVPLVFPRWPNLAGQDSTTHLASSTIMVTRPDQHLEAFHLEDRDDPHSFPVARYLAGTKLTYTFPRSRPTSTDTLPGQFVTPAGWLPEDGFPDPRGEQEQQEGRKEEENVMVKKNEAAENNSFKGKLGEEYEKEVETIFSDTYKTGEKKYHIKMETRFMPIAPLLPLPWTFHVHYLQDVHFLQHLMYLERLQYLHHM